MPKQELNNYHETNEAYDYILKILPIVDIFTISIIFFTSDNPWITTPINLLFPVLGTICGKLAIRDQKVSYLWTGLIIMIFLYGLLLYFGGPLSSAWIHAFPVITGANFIIRKRKYYIIYISCLLLVMAITSGYGELGLTSILHRFIVLFVFSLTIERTISFLNIQKDKIESQKLTIEKTHNEIKDSIKYAKRIQSAILPPQKLVKQHLESSFILYKPKDIVAGDFYWLEVTKDSVFFAVADCTGHGVPGAMVSVICNGGLNRSVREFELTEPGLILDKTRELVIQEFEKSEEEVKDGMDIALCKIEGNTLSYSGANNPLWVIRNGEVLETKADKQPIGKFELEQSFTTHTIELQQGDSIYIFSDGYPDQFGGEKGKKYKSGKFKKFLISIQEYSMEEQHKLLDKEFENWSGKLEQVDDVCVIGVKIK